MANKRTNITIVCSYNFPLAGAPWRRIEYFAEYLSSKKWNVRIIGALSPTCVFMKSRFGHGGVRRPSSFTVHNLQLRLDLLGWPAILTNILGSLPIVMIFLLLRPDVVFVSVPMYDALPMAYIGAKLSGAKFVVDVRDPPEYWAVMSKGATKKLFKLLAEKLGYALLRRAHMIITVTSGLARHLASQGIYAYIVRNGADLKVFQIYPRREAKKALGLGDKELILVFNGKLGNHYDAIPILKAIAKLPEELKEKIRVLFVGGFTDQAYTREFMLAAKRLNVLERVRILKAVQDAQMLAKVLSAGDVGLILLVKSELFDPAVPVKFYEYLACGLPTIALTRQSSELWRLIVEWKVGFACEPNDVDCLVKTLKKIFNEKVIESVRARILGIRPLIDRRRTAEKLHRLLTELLDS